MPSVARTGQISAAVAAHVVTLLTAAEADVREVREAVAPDLPEVEDDAPAVVSVMPVNVARDPLNNSRHEDTFTVDVALQKRVPRLPGGDIDTAAVDALLEMCERIATAFDVDLVLQTLTPSGAGGPVRVARTDHSPLYLADWLRQYTTFTGVVRVTLYEIR